MMASLGQETTIKNSHPQPEILNSVNHNLSATSIQYCIIIVGQGWAATTSKEGNSYLHMVIERLISMTAIKSYTSENGHQRIHVEREARYSGHSHAYIKDSL